jgi:hypothetical protein
VRVPSSARRPGTLRECDGILMRKKRAKMKKSLDTCPAETWHDVIASTPAMSCSSE